MQGIDRSKKECVEIAVVPEVSGASVMEVTAWFVG